MRTLRTILLVIPFFLVLAFLAMFLHELGHGLTAVALGGKFDSLYFIPGIQIWPHFGQPFNGQWNHYIAATFFSYGANWGANSWQDGLVAFMGSGTNAILALVALIALLVFHPRNWLRYPLLAEALMFLDLTLYSSLPLFGLRHFVLWGGYKPEPLLGAEQMGLPEWAFLTLVGLLSMLMLWGWIKALRTASKPRKYPL
jgi:hypothetical protein